MKRLLLLLILVAAIGESERITTIEAENARYDGNKVELTSRVVVHNTLGQLFAEKALLNRDEKKVSGVDFPYMELEGNVLANLEGGRLLKCERLTCDYEKLLTHCFGAPELYYRDEKGEIYAHTAKVEYSKQNGKIEPIKITLTESVRLMSPKTAQYALAHSVEYLIGEEKLILKGSPTEPVLFYDKLKKIELTAHEVHATREAGAGSEAVQGFGDVSFVFKEEDVKRLKERFKWS